MTQTSLDPRLRPFFSFYGSKAGLAAAYPVPRYPRIVECFAGGAGYALRYSAHQVLLCEKDQTLAELWRYLIGVRETEILSLPDTVHHVGDLKGGAAEARTLVGFWLGRGLAQPRQSAGSWARRYGQQAGYRSSFWGPAVKHRIASQLRFIRHWQVVCSSYEGLGALGPATYFLDPPYQGKAGRRYRMGSTALDYPQLGAFCRALPGQVIVCEQAGAAWLPFVPLACRRGMRGLTREVMWTSDALPEPARQMTFSLEQAA